MHGFSFSLISKFLSIEVGSNRDNPLKILPCMNSRRDPFIWSRNSKWLNLAPDMYTVQCYAIIIEQFLRRLE